MSELALNVKNLKVMFVSDRGMIRSVEGIDLQVDRGQCVALVGESGCGKSVTSLTIMGLRNEAPCIWRAEAMELNIDGKMTSLMGMSERNLQEVRGKYMSMIFQDPMNCLNPVMTIGSQIDEVFVRHQGMNKEEAKKNSIDALRIVNVPSPEKRYSDYPHQLSGGMRQRVMIAMAYACRPNFMIADEPTTALDVTIQAQVLDLMSGMQKCNNTGLLLITHDLSVVANMASKIYVMYSGKIVEQASTDELFENPLHPYTRGLIGSIPKLKGTKGERFVQIPDNVPHPTNKPSGCYFHPRCQYADEKCKTYMPPLEKLESGREVRCWRFKELYLGGNK